MTNKNAELINDLREVIKTMGFYQESHDNVESPWLFTEEILKAYGEALSADSLILMIHKAKENLETGELKHPYELHSLYKKCGYLNLNNCCMFDWHGKPVIVLEQDKYFRLSYREQFQICSDLDDEDRNIILHGENNLGFISTRCNRLADEHVESASTLMFTASLIHTLLHEESGIKLYMHNLDMLESYLSYVGKVYNITKSSFDEWEDIRQLDVSQTPTVLGSSHGIGKNYQTIGLVCDSSCYGIFTISENYVYLQYKKGFDKYFTKSIRIPDWVYSKTDDGDYWIAKSDIHNFVYPLIQAMLAEEGFLCDLGNVSIIRSSLGDIEQVGYIPEYNVHNGVELRKRVKEFYEYRGTPSGSDNILIKAARASSV